MADLRHLILLILVAVQVSLAMEPSLVVLPEKIKKAVGQGVYVSCMAEVDDNTLVTEMTWTAPDGRIVTNDDENSVVNTDDQGNPGKLNLVITSLRKEDDGEYTCSAMFAGNRKLEAKIMVESYTDIDFGNTSTHQALTLGQEGKIRCTPKGNPAPQVDWYKNNEPLKNGNGHIIQEDGILITEVTEADEGTYRCRARVINRGSMEHRVIQVEVGIPPVINQPPQNITSKEHENVTFECCASGKPAPTYSWMDKDNRPLENGDEYHMNNDTGVLMIMNLKPEQSGEYRCTATNRAGEDFKTAFLQVYSKPKVEEFLNHTAPQGSELEMKCVVTGNPAPQLIFKKENATMNFTQGINTDKRISVEQRKDDRGREIGILQIKNLSRNDDGLYTCMAESEGGVTQRWGNITVEFSPIFENQRNKVEWSLEKVPVNLTCSATSVPNATIHWYFQNQEVDTNDVNLERLEMGPLGVLRVNPVSSSYFGVYTCKANNTLGTATLDVELKRGPCPSC